MATSHNYIFDVFISYSHSDKDWVHNWLLPRLERASLKICIDIRDFDIGVPSLVNMERAVENSRHTLIILTDEWIRSEWTEFEVLLTQTKDPASRQRRLLPLLLQKCSPPLRIAMLTYADFTNPKIRVEQLQRVLAAVQGVLRLTKLGPTLNTLDEQLPTQLAATKASITVATNTVDGRALREVIVQAFSVEELQILCDDIQHEIKNLGIELEIDLDIIGGNTKPTKVLNLIKYLERRGYYDILVETVRRTRPGII